MNGLSSKVSSTSPFGYHFTSLFCTLQYEEYACNINNIKYERQRFLVMVKLKWKDPDNKGVVFDLKRVEGGKRLF